MRFRDYVAAPVAGVMACALSPSVKYVGKTDARGLFSFVNMVAGTYTVSFAAPHYDHLSIPGLTLVAGQPVALGSIALMRPTDYGMRWDRPHPENAFRPSLTTVSCTLTPDRIEQTIGRTFW
jgi:hypothetical protein